MANLVEDTRVFQTSTTPTGPTGPSLPFQMAPGPVARERSAEVSEPLWHNADALEWAVRDEQSAAWLAKDVPAPERERARRRQLAAKLSRAEPSPPADLVPLHRSALRQSGEPPLVVLRGTIAPSLDPTAELRCWMALVTPFRESPRVAEALEQGRTALEHSPHGTELVVWARRRIEEAYSSLTERHRAPPREWIEQTLVRQRAHDLCRAFGREQLRAMLIDDAGNAVLACYLDAAIADELPLLPRFGARMLCRIRASLEAREGVCAEVVAVARIMGG